MFEAIGSFFADIWDKIVVFFSTINIFTSAIDILVVAFVIFSLIKLIRDSRAEQLIKGVVLLLVVYGAAKLLDLQALQYLISILFDNALILVVVVFQPEIRRALEQMGHTKLSDFGSHDTPDQTKEAIAAVCNAVELLQRQRMGALIVFERATKLGDIINSGTVVDAGPSTELIGNVFFNKAPLHDGAMIIRGGRVYAAGCILPLTANLALSSSLGTRHRAAVGMSENSDALIVVVSEETGTISLAQGGRLTRDYTPKTLRVALENEMLSDLAQDEANPFKKLLKKGRKGRDGE